MTAFLANLHPNMARDPANREQFFDAKEEIPTIKKFISDRECTNHKKFPPPCTVGLFFGFFFDGTNNNLNKARLQAPFPQQCSATVLTRIYENKK